MTKTYRDAGWPANLPATITLSSVQRSWIVKSGVPPDAVDTLVSRCRTALRVASAAHRARSPAERTKSRLASIQVHASKLAGLIRDDGSTASATVDEVLQGQRPDLENILRTLADRAGREIHEVEQTRDRGPALLAATILQFCSEHGIKPSRSQKSRCLRIAAECFAAAGLRGPDRQIRDLLEGGWTAGR